MEFKQWLENASSMRIKIVDNPVVTGPSIEADKYRKALKSYAGQWLPVETGHLFGDQFNTAPPSNLRVFIKDVADIEGDVRPAAARCGWCGTTYINVPDTSLGEPCPKCNVYPMQELATIDRIRPLVTVENGRPKTIYPAVRQKRIKTPEGDVWR